MAQQMDCEGARRENVEALRPAPLHPKLQYFENAIADLQAYSIHAQEMEKLRDEMIQTQHEAFIGTYDEFRKSLMALRDKIESLDARITSLEKSMNKRMNAVESRVSEVENDVKGQYKYNTRGFNRIQLDLEASNKRADVLSQWIAKMDKEISNKQISEERAMEYINVLRASVVANQTAK